MSVSFSSSDFLSPNTIARKTNNFVDKNVGTVSSSGFNLGKNPDATDILNISNSGVNGILGSNLGISIFQQPGTGPNSNFNPLIWDNPNPLNILLGVVGSTSDVLNGLPLAFPPFSLFPTQSTAMFPFQPFQSGLPAAVSQTIPTQNSLFTPIQFTRPLQAFPVNISQWSSPNASFGQPNTFPSGMISQPRFPQFASGGGFQSGFPVTQPFSIAGTRSIQGFGNQVSIMQTLLMTGWQQMAAQMPTMVPNLPPARYAIVPAYPVGGNPFALANAS